MKRLHMRKTTFSNIPRISGSMQNVKSEDAAGAPNVVNKYDRARRAI